MLLPASSERTPRFVGASTWLASPVGALYNRFTFNIRSGVRKKLNFYESWRASVPSFPPTCDSPTPAQLVCRSSNVG